MVVVLQTDTAVLAGMNVMLIQHSFTNGPSTVSVRTFVVIRSCFIPFGFRATVNSSSDAVNILDTLQFVLKSGVSDDNIIIGCS